MVEEFDAGSEDSKSRCSRNEKMVIQQSYLFALMGCFQKIIRLLPVSSIFDSILCEGPEVWIFEFVRRVREDVFKVVAKFKFGS